MNSFSDTHITSIYVRSVLMFNGFNVQIFLYDHMCMYLCGDTFMYDFCLGCTIV